MCARCGLDPRMPGWDEFRRGLITLSTLKALHEAVADLAPIR